MGRETINPDELSDAPALGYSHAVVADGTLYTSGQVARNGDNEIVGDDIETQARKAFDNVGVLLDEVGKGFEDVAKVTTYLVDPAGDGVGYGEVWMDVFDEPYPCGTTIGVDALADPDYLVEIEVEVPLDG